MAPGKIVDYEAQFEKSLDEARHRIDLSTTVGKNLDKILTPLYRKYGFVDNITKLVDMDATKIPTNQIPFVGEGKILPAEKIFDNLGIDMKWYKNAIANQKGLESKHKHELTDLTNLYLKASHAMQGVAKKFAFDLNNSGNLAWDVFGVLHWVTDFSKALEKVKHESGEHHLMHETEIIEALQKRIYHSPKKVISNLTKVAEEFNTDIYTVKSIFETKMGVTPREYSKMVLNEGLGDYLSHAGQKLANKVVSKYGIGQSKVAAQSKLGSLKDTNNVLTKWTQLTQGNQAAATPQALSAFLTGQLNINPDVAASVIKKYKPVFKQTPQDLAKAKKMASSTKNDKFEKTLSSIDPNAPEEDDGVVGESIKVNEAYLPSGKLRNFFLDAINAQRMSVLNPAKKPAVAKPIVPQANPTVQTQVNPAAPLQVNPAKPAPVAASPKAAPVQPTAPTKPTITDFKAAIAALPAGQRAEAITQALPELSDDEIRQVLTNLTTRKK